jgi:uncharacterized protein YegJ (DUF2314 family)
MLFPLLWFLAWGAIPGVAQSKYADRPAAFNQKGAEIIRQYEEQARQGLPRFDEELAKPDGRKFYVVTKLFEAMRFEQVFVEVRQRTADGYRGVIASDPLGPVKFRKGAPIEVPRSQVVDWCIVQKTGEEIGNVLGKAVEALMAGGVAFIIRLEPEDGRFVRMTVSRVVNPRTQQEVPELVPAHVFADVEAEAQKRFGDLRAADAKEKFHYILVQFPEWKILPP